MSRKTSFRIATYNIHKCIGLDRKISPERIAAVILETRADIVALQEVVRAKAVRRGGDQFEKIVEGLDLPYGCFGENRSHWGGGYGNAILSRWPITSWHNHDVSIGGREPRGMLQADVEIPGCVALHVLNIHLGTGYMERRKQTERLLGEEALLSSGFSGPRILLGDFNEWTRGLATRRLKGHMKSAEPIEVEGASRNRAASRRMRSYPGIAPLLHLDHIYYDNAFRLREFRLHRSRTALLASDHLPLVACFEIEV